MRKVALALLLSAVCLGGCNGNGEAAKAETTTDTRSTTSSTAAKTDAAGGKTPAPTASASGHYEEVRRDKAIYVAGTPESAAKIRAGDKFAHSVTALGFGPGGEKVYFETDKEGKLDQRLMAEFEKRH